MSGVEIPPDVPPVGETSNCVSNILEENVNMDTSSVSTCEHSTVSTSICSGQGSVNKNVISIDIPTSTDARQSNIFTNVDCGPFYIYIESKGDEHLGRLHPMSVGRIIHTNHSNLTTNIVGIKSIGKNRIKVELKSASSANALVASSYLLASNFRVYIPDFLVKRHGIVRGIDCSIDDNSLITLAETNIPNCKIIGVQRFSRRITKDQNIEFIPTQTVKFTFEGQVTPSYITILSVRCEVEPYIQRVIQCFNCLRYGHMSKQCKSSARCKNCGEAHSSDSCPNETICVHCKGKHVATDISVCPSFERQKAIKKYMYDYKVSYNEAYQNLNGKSYSTFAANLAVTNGQFPQLGKPKQSLNFKNTSSSLPNHSSINIAKSLALSQNYTSSQSSKRKRPTIPSSPVETATKKNHQNILKEHNMFNFGGSILNKNFSSSSTDSSPRLQTTATKEGTSSSLFFEFIKKLILDVKQPNFNITDLSSNEFERFVENKFNDFNAQCIT